MKKRHAVLFWATFLLFVSYCLFRSSLQSASQYFRDKAAVEYADETKESK